MYLKNLKYYGQAILYPAVTGAAPIKIPGKSPCFLAALMCLNSEHDDSLDLEVPNPSNAELLRTWMCKDSQMVKISMD